jgi:hypothetical protein
MSTNPKIVKIPAAAPTADQWTLSVVKAAAAKAARTAKKLYNHIDRAYYQREKGETVADVLHAAAIANPADPNYEENLAHALRIKNCSAKDNYYTAEDLPNEQTGECYDGFGHLAACCSKLCIACNANASRRNKKTAAAAVAGTKLVRKIYKDYEDENKIKIQQERLRLVTLTLPPLQEACLDSLEILAEVFQKFRKTDVFKNYISGFVRGSEFTTRKNGTIHPHAHLLCASVFIADGAFKAQFTKCVENVYQRRGIQFDVETASGFCVVNYTYVSDIDSALKEICKYITKSDSWSEVPAAQLLEVAAVKRFPKMFSLGGKFAATSERLKREAAAVKTTNVAVKTTNVIDAERESYLDTKSVSGSFSKEELLEITEVEAKAALLKRTKKPNWRTLVRLKGYEQYKVIFEAQFDKQKRYRKRQLAEKYPLTTFTDGNGVVFASPKLGFVEEFNVTTGETLVWNAPKPQPVEVLDFDEERARAEYPEYHEEFEEFEYIPDYIPEVPDYFELEFSTVREMEHAAEAVAVAVVQEYNELDEFGW